MNEWFKARNAWAGAFETLSDAEAGRLAKALWRYTTTGEEAELSGSEKGCFAMILWTLRMDEEQSASTSDARRLAGLASAEKRKATKPENVEFVDNIQQNQQAPTNPTDKNKNKNQNKKEILNTTTTGAREEETPFGPVTIDPLIVKVQAELNGLTDTHYQRLEDYRQHLGDELVSYAIDAAVGNGVRNWAYVEAILAGYQRENVRSIGDAKARDEKRRERPKTGEKGKVLNAQKFGQRDYTEDELRGTSEDDILKAIQESRKEGTA